MSDTTVPLVMTSAGPQPTPVTAIQQDVIDGATALSPGLTANLPGSMIEDVSSTAVAAIVQADQARVDAVNSISPLAANGFVLALLGAQLGIPQGQANNTSASVTFTVTSSGSAVSGFQIPTGVLVSDGANQYATQTAVTTNASGVAGPVAVVATQPGSWAVAAGAVNTVSTSFPSAYTVTVTNASPGVAGTAPQSVQSYRAQVLQAENVAVMGTPAFIASTINAIPGINARLTNAVAASGGLKIIAGLTVDQNLIAGAIYQSVPDVATLQGSATTARNVTTNVIDGANNYAIVFVNPPNQTVTAIVTWNTDIASFSSGVQVSQLAATALVSYINSLQQGSAINIDVMTATFQTAVASILPAAHIIALTFTVDINGSTVAPNTGTVIIPGDPESYFSATPNAFAVSQA